MALRRLLPPALLLAAYGVAFAMTALGGGTPAFDDHPGQLYRLVHVVARGFAPWRWEPGWWAGYPELQFYPPGFSWAGGALHALSLGRLDAEACYRTLVWATYLAPGAATWLALTRLLGNGWAALPGAFVAQALSGPLASGVEGGVHVGMAPARLAWALLPLLLTVLARWVDGAARFPLLAVPLLAAVALTHPAHLPAAVVLVALGAGLGPRRRVLAAALGLALAAALTAVWTLPLVAHVGETRALAWGRLEWAFLARPLPLVLLALGALALRGGRTPVERVIAWFPWVMAGAVAVDALALEPLGLRWLPADRVADGAWLGFVLAAGLVTGRFLGGAGGGAVPALAAVALAVVLSLPGATLALWPRADLWPTYDTVARGLRLPDLWSALREAPGGRVLYLRSGVPLVYGTAWWRPHSHVTALTPLAAGRAIVHGTFTHPAPLAALVYRGDAGPGAIRRLTEQADGRELFGRPLGSLDGPALAPFLDRLGVAVVVAIEDDVGLVPALEDARVFRRRAVPPFVLYERTGAVAIPEEVGPDHWRVRLAGAAGTWTGARLAWYPLWRAESGGVPVPVRRGAFGDLEVRLRAADADVDLRYAAGVAELAGVATSLAGIAGLGAWALARRRGAG